MTMRKLLSVFLCVAAVLSVMALVATSARAQVPDMAAPPPSTEPTAPPAPWYISIYDWWQGFYPVLKSIYEFGFKWVSQILTWALNLLLSILGINLWNGPIFMW